MKRNIFSCLILKILSVFYRLDLVINLTNKIHLCSLIKLFGIEPRLAVRPTSVVVRLPTEQRLTVRPAPCGGQTAH
jgi:hypothetical protein